MQETINIVRGDTHTSITYIDSGQIAEIHKHKNKFHEYNMLEAISKLKINMGTFIDIGAHVGNHSIFFAKYCRQCTEVLSFELSPITFETLHKNTLHYSNIFAYNIAIGAKIGQCSVNHNEARPGQSEMAIGRSIHISPIDSIHFNQPPVLIKIDVEGNEYDVLEGGVKTIDKYKPELFVETFSDPELLLDFLPVPSQYKIVKRYNNAPTYHLSAK